MFVDSDDWVDPDYCEVFIRHYQEDCLVFANPLLARPQSDKITRVNKKEALLLRGAGIESPVLKLFDASIIKRERLRFPGELSLGEDFIFVLRYLACIDGDLIRLEYSGYHYEINECGSLSKKIPSCEQTEYFYKLLLGAMNALQINDQKSCFIVNRSCMLDFEKLISSLARNGELRFAERYHRTRSIMSCNTYKKTCLSGVGSGNRIYEMLYKNRMSFLLTAYYSVKR